MALRARASRSSLFHTSGFFRPCDGRERNWPSTVSGAKARGSEPLSRSAPARSVAMQTPEQDAPSRRLVPLFPALVSHCSLPEGRFRGDPPGSMGTVAGAVSASDTVSDFPN